MKTFPANFISAYCRKVVFAMDAADIIVFKTAIRHRRLVLSLGCGSTAVTHIWRALNTTQHTYSRGAANWEQ